LNSGLVASRMLGLVAIRGLPVALMVVLRILTQQGPNAPGGALSYVVKGKMIGGFALLAYPAEYGNSGVMTFLVNHNGVVYQKDLGDYTQTLVKRMNWFDPDQTWKKVDAAKP
jgi:hypothetical protein